VIKTTKRQILFGWGELLPRWR